jgi:polyhydroxyalkanoate synthesis regulator phasin
MSDMNDLIRKVVLTGIGLAALTKEKIEEVVKEVVEKGKLSEKEGKEFIDELLKKSEGAKEKVEGQIEKALQATLRKMNLVTRDEFSKLEKQLKQLKKDVKEGTTKK